MLKSGKVRQGKFENNVYVGKIEKDAVKPQPLKESKVTKKKEEKKEEKLKEKAAKVEMKDMSTSCAIKVAYEIMTQTLPEPIETREKEIQTKTPAAPKMMKERANQTIDLSPVKVLK